MNPVRCEYLSVWDKSGKFIATPVVSNLLVDLMSKADRKQVTKDLQRQLGIEDDWLLVHRVDLHNALYKKALEGFQGRGSKTHLACSITSVVTK
jgi:salicylate hydroxylase